MRRFTAARIALGRTGVSLPTARHLEFQMAHALARDAVHAVLDVEALVDELRSMDSVQDVLCLHSAAADRLQYLQRPDLGRRLDDASCRTLQAVNAPVVHELSDADCDAARFDLAFVVADGLSAQAVARHAAPLLGVVLPSLISQGRTVAPIAVVEQGRVAIGDEIGQLLGARLVVVLIGERPGLSSPDSLGVYLTFAPRTGRTDAERNCISNVRPEGLPIEQAARRLLWLMDQALARGLSGVGLKDETGQDQEEIMQVSSFLLPQPTATGW